MPDEIIAKNKKAYHDYEIVETFEAGLMLSGTEVKSVRKGDVSLKGSYVTFRGTTPFLTNTHIAHYKPAGEHQHDPTRARRLLLKQSEITKLIGKMQAQGVTAVPLEIYFKGRWAKVKIGLGKGKKLHDKRRSIKERETKRIVDRAVRGPKR